MYDLLKFIDSLQVREYNRETYFTPAEWAVIVANSITATVEEKLDALQYLTEHYGEEDFAKESVNVGSGHAVYHEHLPFGDDVRETMRIWKETLEDRYHEDGFIYAAKYEEKGRYCAGQIEEYRFFPDYEKAFMYLAERRDRKRESEFFRKENFFGEIGRFKPDGGRNRDTYIFDGDLRMVELLSSSDRWNREDGSYIDELNEPEAYQVFVPLPFKKGDIIKVESDRTTPFYGVMCCDWKCVERDWTQPVWLPLDCYNEEYRDFDYVDGGYCDVLRGSVSSEEELPENQKMLKQISAVYKGEMDFMELLSQFSKREL